MPLLSVEIDLELTSRASDSNAEEMICSQVKPKWTIKSVACNFQYTFKLIFWESKEFPLMKRNICLPSTPEAQWAAINCLVLSILLLSSVISKWYVTIRHVQAFQFVFLLSGTSNQRAGQCTRGHYGSLTLNGCLSPAAWLGPSQHPNCNWYWEHTTGCWACYNKNSA